MPISLGDIFKQSILSGMLSLLFFIILRIVYNEILNLTLQQAVDANNLVTMIIFLGFVLAVMVAIGVNFLISEGQNRKVVFYGILFAFLSNLGIWILITNFFLMRQYPEIYPKPDTGSLFGDIIVTGIFYLLSIPTVMGYFAIYIIHDVVRFWIYTLIGFTVMYAFFLGLFSRVKQRTILGGK